MAQDGVRYRGKFITIRRRRLTLPGGKVTEVDVIEHPPAATIVPVLDDGRVVMIRQYRPVMGAWLWELPAGKLDAGEDAEVGARRELAEETGHAAATMTWLTGFYPAPGVLTEWMDVWVARGLTRVPLARDDDEVIRVKKFTREQIEHMLDTGKIKDAKSLVGLLAFLRESSAEVRPPLEARASRPARTARSASSAGRRR